MNRKQREQNRKNANRLRLNAHVCENCGERGGHWIQTGAQSLAMAIIGLPDVGFWTCAKYYGPDGKRLPEGPNFAFGMDGLGWKAASNHHAQVRIEQRSRVARRRVT